MSKISDFLKKERRGFCTVVVAAAGASTRMGEDKLFMDLGGMPVLARTLTAFERCDAVQEIIVVTRAESLDRVGELRGRYGLSKLKKVLIGGDTRTASCLAGVTEADAAAQVICIHDGCRPFATDGLIRSAIDLAAKYEAAAPAVPVKDTLKFARDGIVESTLDRSALFAIQTPQCFRAPIIKAALTKAVTEGISYTDDCAAAEALGVTVRLSPGSEENIKLTTPADLAVGEAILKRRGERNQ